jgi:hypothetical protein
MRNCDNLEKGYSTVPGNFMVYLFPGHSFEDHSRAVGKDMAIYKEHWLESLFPDRVVYACDDVGDDLLDAIRNDPGVDGVECNITPGAMIPEMYFNEADGKWHDMFTEEVWEI